MEITYLGGSLPEEAVDALTAAVSGAVTGAVSELQFSVITHLYDKILLSTKIRSGSSLEAITYLNTEVDEAMFRTGLFEQFDVTGKQFEIAPLETYRERSSPQAAESQPVADE